MNQKNYLFFVLLCLLSFIPLTGQKKLAYNLKAGETYIIKQSAVQDIVQKIDSIEHTITIDLGALFEFKVDSVYDEHYILSIAYKNFSMKMTSSIQGVLMDVDTNNPVEGDITSDIFQGLLGHQMKMTMLKNGDITEIRGGDELIEKMISSSGITDEFTKNLMKKSLEKDFSSQGLSDSFEQLTYIYPNSTVAVGDSWTNSFQGKLVADNTWTLSNLSSVAASINGKSQVTMSNEENGVVMKLAGNQSSDVFTDAKTGFIKNCIVSGKFEGTSVMAQMGNIEIPTTIDSKITYELIPN